MADRDIEIDRSKYPPNHMDQPSQEGKIIRGRVVEKRRSFLERLSCSDDLKDVIDYVVRDIFIPAAKNLFYDCVVGGLRSSIYGEGGRGVRGGVSRYGRDSGPRYTAYGSRYREDDRGDREYRHVKNVYEPVVLEYRADCLDVIDRMREKLRNSKDGEVTVGYLYGLVGKYSDFEDEYYGWRDLRDADVRTVRDGFMVMLPRPVLLR